jgi:gluconolactonase
MTDGCAFDGTGNVWVTLPVANQVVAITPDLRVITILDDPERRVLRAPTNIAFGGANLRRVYIGAVQSDYVVTAHRTIPGVPTAAQA